MIELQGGFMNQKLNLLQINKHTQYPIDSKSKGKCGFYHLF